MKTVIGITALIFSCIFSQDIPAQTVFSGPYTIGGQVGLKNYTSISAAVSALSTGVVTDKTTFDIRPGTYSGKVSIPPIAGTSSTRTVTFQSESGQASDVIVTAPGEGSSDTNSYTIQLRGASFITLRNLTIVNTALTRGSGVNFLLEANNDSIVGCTVLLDSMGNGGSLYGVLGAGGATTATVNTPPNGDTAVVTGTTFVGGNVPVQWIGNSLSAHDRGLVVTNNTCRKFVTTGINCQYVDIKKISRNTITGRIVGGISSAGSGMYFNNCDGDFVIDRNYIANVGVTGMSFTSCNGTTAALIANNIIAGGFDPSKNSSYGISMTGSLTTINTNLSFFYNSVYLDGDRTFNAATSSALRFDAGAPNQTPPAQPANIKFKNNIFYATRAWAYSFNGPTNTFSENDYNCIYSSGNELVSGSSNLASLQTGGFNTNSISVDPVFVSAADLRPLNSAMNNKGTPLSSPTTDFTGATRSATAPDIGAIEFSPRNIDIALVAVGPPSVALGNNTVTCTLKNLGVTSLDGSTISLSYSSDGGTSWSAPETFAINGLPALLSSVTYTFSQPLSISVSGYYTICARINPPGLSGDADHTNEKVCLDVCTGSPGGVFTVGGTNPDFVSLASAAASLPACGITGPVVFNIRPALYNEAITIPYVIGASEKNTITFQSETGNANDVIVARPAGAVFSVKWAIALQGAQYIVLKNLTLTNASTQNEMSAVNFQRTADGRPADHNTVTHCVIRVDSSGGANYTSAILFSDVNASGGFINDQTDANYNVIADNIISGGDKGIYAIGVGNAYFSSGNKILRNTITSSYSNGVYLYFQDSAEVSGNTILPRTTYSSGTALSGSFVSNFAFDGNYISGAGNTAIRADQISGSANRITNNMIAGGFRNTSNCRGIDLYGPKNVDVKFNSVNMDKSGASNSAFYFSGGGSNMNVLNNIFSASADGYAYYNGNTSGSLVAQSDYNDLYTTGSNLGSWNNVNQTSLAAFQSASGTDAHSVSVDPSFTSPTDLHTTSQNVRGKATYLTEVPLDFDGDARKPAGPDIGADETPGIDIAVAHVAPQAAKLGANTIVVTLLNNGIVSLKDSSISLSYSSDNGLTWSAPETFTPTGLITFDSKQEYTFSRAWVITAIGNYHLCVRVNPPGLIKDLNKVNDQLCIDVCADSSAIASSRATIDFGMLQCSDTYRDSIVTIRNVGDYSITVATTITGSSVFSVTPMSASIAPGLTRNFTVRFQPSGNEVAIATLLFSTFCGADTIHLLGEKNSVADITASPLTVNFGSLACESERDTFLVVKNTGDADLSLSAASVSGKNFSLVDPVGPQTLYIGDSILYTVHVNVASNDTVGVYNGTFDMTASPCNLKLSRPLRARKEYIHIAAVENSLRFGTLDCGKAKSDSVVRITNTGSAPVTIVPRLEGNDPTNFSVTPTTISILPGQTTTFNIRFTAPSSGAYTADAIFETTTCVVADTIHLSGASSDAASIAGSPAVLDFDTIACGPQGGSKDSIILVRNTGPNAVTLDTGKITGSAAFMFLSPLKATRVFPGDTVRYVIRFAPTSQGTQTATCTIRGMPPCNVITTHSLIGTCNGAIDVEQRRDVSHGEELGQNYPNPCGELSVISYELSEKNPFGIFEVRDMLGRILYRQHVERSSSLTLNVSTFPPGTYCYTLFTAGSHIARRMIVAR